MLRARPYERRVATMTSATAKIFADRCIADKFLANQGLPKPDNYEPYGQNSRPWRSFCNGTAVGGQKPGFETFRNVLISEMSSLFEQGCEQPRLERGRSSIGTDGPGGGDPRSYLILAAARRISRCGWPVYMFGGVWVRSEPCWARSLYSSAQGWSLYSGAQG